MLAREKEAKNRTGKTHIASRDKGPAGRRGLKPTRPEPSETSTRGTLSLPRATKIPEYYQDDDEEGPEWYVGLEQESPFKRVGVLETQGATIEAHINRGYRWIWRFSDLESVERWIRSGRPIIIDLDVAEPTPLSSRPTPSTVPIPGPPHVDTPDTLPEDPTTGTPPMFLVGKDPSEGNDKQIYGIDVLDQERMDKVLAPTGLPKGKDMIQLYERAMDVSALLQVIRGRMEDGTYNTGENEELRATMELSVLAVSQSALNGTSRRGVIFQADRFNPLEKVRNEKQLNKLYEGLDPAADDDMDAQEQHLSSFMFQRGYSSTAIRLYLDSGGLPQLIQRALFHYRKLIDAIVAAARTQESNGSLWEGSLAQMMVKHYGRKLAGIRERANYFRDVVLSTYIYLREANARSFQHDKFNKAIWQRVAENEKKYS